MVEFEMNIFNDSKQKMDTQIKDSLDKKFVRVTPDDTVGEYKNGKTYQKKMLNSYWKAKDYQISSKPELFNAFDTVLLSGNDLRFRIAFGQSENSQPSELKDDNFPGAFVSQFGFKTYHEYPPRTKFWHRCFQSAPDRQENKEIRELAASVVLVCKDTIKNVIISNGDDGFEKVKKNLLNCKIELLKAKFDNWCYYARTMAYYPLEVEDYRLILDFRIRTFSDLQFFDVMVKQSLFVKAYCDHLPWKHKPTKNPFLGNLSRPIKVPSFTLSLTYKPRYEDINICDFIRSILLWAKENCSAVVKDCNILVEFGGRHAESWPKTDDTTNVESFCEDIVPDFECYVRIYCETFTPSSWSFTPNTTVQLINAI